MSGIVGPIYPCGLSEAQPVMDIVPHVVGIAQPFPTFPFKHPMPQQLPTDWYHSSRVIDKPSPNIWTQQLTGLVGPHGSQQVKAGWPATLVSVEECSSIGYHTYPRKY